MIVTSVIVSICVTNSVKSCDESDVIFQPRIGQYLSEKASKELGLI